MSDYGSHGEEMWDEDPEDDGYPYDDEDEDSFGVCDHATCNATYLVSGSDHCTTEGLCWQHCTDRLAHDPYYLIQLDQFIEEHA
jgi:hypothetical protein